MDFIEQLPPSSNNSYTAILVVVDRFTKQSIFIPTFNTITSAQLVELFVVHVFSKHGVPVMNDSPHTLFLSILYSLFLIPTLYFA